MVRRILLSTFVALVMLLIVVPVALAATPQDIYDDYRDNGKLDGTYTQAELLAYLNDPTIHQYGDSSILEPLDDLIRDMTKQREVMPFTGYSLLLVAGGALLFIGVGLLLRRSRNMAESKD